MQKFVTFLMFEGQAEAAMNLYTSVFPDAEIMSISRHGAEGPGKEGSVIHASFSLQGQTFMAIDSYVQHGFTFTPAMSIYVNCSSDEEIERYFAALSEGGKVMMPLGAYPFSKKYAWLSDRFGVSWQLSLNA